ncbi:unnamed protein product [Closterium sp. Naga37s-1]|nr:unnamed protein product [Closterium sp. Naga37s-1]
MKQQNALGINRIRLVGVTDRRRSDPLAPGPSSSLAPEDSTGDVDAAADGFDELIFEDESYCNSDGYTAADVVDEVDEDSPLENDVRGKRKVTGLPPKKSHWTPEELTELAAAMWMAKDDFDSMKGKQGAQFWKKLRRVMRIANPTWRRPSKAMSKQWPRLKQRMDEIFAEENTTRIEPQPRPEWFQYVDNWWNANMAPNPHVVDEDANAPMPSIPVRRRATESAAYAGHMLVAETMARSMAERGNRQDAPWDRQIAVLERMAPMPPHNTVPPTQAPNAAGNRSGTPSPGTCAASGFTTPASWFPPRPAPPTHVPSPPAMAPFATQNVGDTGTARQLYADPSFLQHIPVPIAMDSNGQWFFTAPAAEGPRPHGA